MLLGCRITKKEEVGLYNADLIQASFYKGWGVRLEELKEIASLCRERKIRYVIHPVNFFLSETRPREREETMEALRLMAQWTDLGLIIHDECTPWGGRLFGLWERNYRDGIEELQRLCRISIENANNSCDAIWFWRNFASSITVDIGHLEAAGINAYKAVRDFPDDLLNKLEYIHLHRNNGLRAGLTDHWPLTRRCREIKALERLLKRRSDIKVILEVNETEAIEENLRIVKELALKRTSYKTLHP